MSFLTPAMVKQVKVPRLDLGELLHIPLSSITHHTKIARKMAVETEQALKTYGVFEIENHGITQHTINHMMKCNIEFFDHSEQYKSQYLHDGISYNGYIQSYSEKTGDKHDSAEIFTVCKDIDKHSKYVKHSIPCHGKVHWPNTDFKRYSKQYLLGINTIGQYIVKLLAISLNLEANHFDKIINDPWLHMRVLHFPPCTINTEEDDNIGIHSHTDYGLLVIAAQDNIGGLFIRPPIPNEYRPINIYDENTSAIDYDDKKWVYVKPHKHDNVLTVFPGDFLQYITSFEYKATPHKVMTNNKDRYALASFFEPNFDSYHFPINHLYNDEIEPIHYGTHFTKMFMRCYPDSKTTKNIVEKNLLERAQISKYFESINENLDAN